MKTAHVVNLTLMQAEWFAEICRGFGIYCLISDNRDGTAQVGTIASESDRKVAWELFVEAFKAITNITL